jgi:hypothetical protein
MKLPAIDTPDQASDAARRWAYRIGTLAFDAKVEDVALIVQAAMDEAVRQSQIGGGTLVSDAKPD